MISDVVRDEDDLDARVIQSTRTSEGTQSNNHQAYILITLSSSFIVLMQLCLKQLSLHMESTLVLGVRGSLLFVCNSIWLIKNKQQIHVRDPAIYRSLVKRAIASSVTVVMYMGSIQYLPIGICNSLFNTSPIMTFFIEVFYYKKSKIKIINLILILISFSGVVLIIQPEFLFGTNSQANSNYVFYFVVLLSALTGSFSMIFLHELRDKCNELLVLQYVYFFQMISSLFLFMVKGSSKNEAEYLHTLSFAQMLRLFFILVLLVIFSFLVQYLQTKALYLASSPALILPFGYFSVVFGMLLDVFLFDSQYNYVTVIGMTMASFGLFSKFILLYFPIHSSAPPNQ